MGILTKVIVQQAVEIVRPSAEAILATPGATWGPRWVDGLFCGPGLDEPVPYLFGEKTDWDPAWGDEADFEEIADAKLNLSHRVGEKTGIVVTETPWLLVEGEYLYAGGAHRDGLSASASGAKSYADQAISEMLLSAVAMLCRLEAQRRIKEDRAQI